MFEFHLLFDRVGCCLFDFVDTIGVCEEDFDDEGSRRFGCGAGRHGKYFCRVLCDLNNIA